MKYRPPLRHRYSFLRLSSPSFPPASIFVASAPAIRLTTLAYKSPYNLEDIKSYNDRVTHAVLAPPTNRRDSYSDI